MAAARAAVRAHSSDGGVSRSCGDRVSAFGHGAPSAEISIAHLLGPYRVGHIIKPYH